MSELFEEYTGYSDKDGLVAAALIEAVKVVQLCQITGGIAVWRTLRGGSRALDGLILNGVKAQVGDYVVALDGNAFVVMKKDEFEKKYKYRGPLRSPVI